MTLVNVSADTLFEDDNLNKNQIIEEKSSIIHEDANYESKQRKDKNKYKYRFGICPKCYGPNNISAWCYQCDNQNLIANFQSSGNHVIDEFLLNNQRDSSGKYFEWIPFDRFENIKHLADGGFGKVYTATWLDGEKTVDEIDDPNMAFELINHVSPDNKCFLDNMMVKPPRIEIRKRTPPITVVLKSLCNSHDISMEFLSELRIHHELDSFVPECYGITKDPAQDEYMMVFKYIRGGEFRHWIKKKGVHLEWAKRIALLTAITHRLEYIHNYKIIHRDIHGGNVLLDTMIDDITEDNKLNVIFITDFGLSRPANTPFSTPEGTFGIMSYMAPELLIGQKHTFASDVYSLGILMWELAANGKTAFGDLKHDQSLMYSIYKGRRPSIPPNTPQCWSDLMQKCWDTDPNKRPTAEILYSIVNPWSRWYKDLENAKSYEYELDNRNIEDDGNIFPYPNDPEIFVEHDEGCRILYLPKQNAVDIHRQFQEAEEARLNLAKTVKKEEADSIYRSQFISYITPKDNESFQSDQDDSFWNISK
ncbi:kinase-like domain-containing protein [Glomus cerebriforme]|uniref:Kinase-like domain-containing protein n=1 Tax=Glomus cerebriforme TaxID=658196 RepID=A0A397SHK6_9GLOM|nr:kinase-like domain-containing protein [Glomus cerebriforme]